VQHADIASLPIY